MGGTFDVQTSPHSPPHRTNICKISQLGRAISSLSLDVSPLNLCKSLILRHSLEQCRTDIRLLVFIKSWKKKTLEGSVFIHVVNRIYFLCSDTVAAIQDDNERDQSTSLMNFLRNFNQNRDHVTNPEGKRKARDFIKKTFKDLGLITWSEPFKPDFPQVRFKLSFYWVVALMVMMTFVYGWKTSFCKHGGNTFEIHIDDSANNQVNDEAIRTPDLGPVYMEVGDPR